MYIKLILHVYCTAIGTHCEESQTYSSSKFPFSFVFVVLMRKSVCVGFVHIIMFIVDISHDTCTIAPHTKGSVGMLLFLIKKHEAFMNKL